MASYVEAVCWHCGSPVGGVPGQVATCRCGALNRVTGAGQVGGFEASKETLAEVANRRREKVARREAWWRARRRTIVVSAVLFGLVATLATVYLVAAGRAGGELGDRIRSGDLGADMQPFTAHYRFSQSYAGVKEGTARVDPAQGLVAWQSESTPVVTDVPHGLEYWQMAAGRADVYRDYSPAAPMAQLAGRDVHMGLVLCPPQWDMCGNGFSGSTSHGHFTGHIDTQRRLTDLRVVDDRWGLLEFDYTYGEPSDPVATPATAHRKGFEVQMALARGSAGSCFLFGCSAAEPPSATITVMRHSVDVSEVELQIDGKACQLDLCGLEWQDRDGDGFLSQGDRLILSGGTVRSLVVHDLWADEDVYHYTAGSPFPAGLLVGFVLLGAAAVRRRAAS